MNRTKICVIGLGYVGLTLAASLAKVGYQVSGVEKDREKVAMMLRGEAPFHEPQLAPLLERCSSEGTLAVVDDLDSIKSIRFDTIFSCVGTPLKEGTREADLSQLTSAGHQVGRILRKGVLVVNRSTVPVGTTRSVFMPILEEESGLRAGSGFLLACAPERTVQGAALRELRELPQIIGGVNDESVSRAADILNRLTRTIARVSSLEAAEAIKLFDNTYRDVNIAIGNMFGLACEELGLDAHEIVQAANFGYSRNRILLPGAGVGGVCLEKDPHLLLASVPDTVNCDLIRTARSINEGMPLHVADILQRELSSLGVALESATVLVLGFAFKGDPPTDDVRNSPSSTLVDALKESGVRIFGYDPVVDAHAIESMGTTPVTDLTELHGEVDAVVLMTNHRAHAELDLTQFRKKEQPLVIIDGWNILERIGPEDGIVHRCIGVGLPPRRAQ